MVPVVLPAVAVNKPVKIRALMEISVMTNVPKAQE